MEVVIVSILAIGSLLIQQHLYTTHYRKLLDEQHLSMMEVIRSGNRQADKGLNTAVELAKITERIVNPTVIHEVENPDSPTSDFYTSIANPFAHLPDPEPHYEEDPPPLPVTEPVPEHDPFSEFGNPADLPPHLKKALGWEHYTKDEEPNYGS